MKSLFRVFPDPFALFLCILSLCRIFMVPGMDRRNSVPPVSHKNFCASALFFFEEYRTMKDASGIGMIPPFWSGCESLNSKTTHDPDIISDTLHTQTSTPTRESHTQQRFGRIHHKRIITSFFRKKWLFFIDFIRKSAYLTS